MMDLHLNKVLQGITGHPKDECQLVVYLCKLIVVILWRISHCYCHYCYYAPHNNGSFMLFFYLIVVYDLLLYALMILKTSVPSVETSPTLSIAGVQSLPAARCAYSPYTASPFCSIYHHGHGYTTYYMYITCIYIIN